MNVVGSWCFDDLDYENEYMHVRCSTIVTASWRAVDRRNDLWWQFLSGRRTINVWGGMFISVYDRGKLRSRRTHSSHTCSSIELFMRRRKRLRYHTKRRYHFHIVSENEVIHFHKDFHTKKKPLLHFPAHIAEVLVPGVCSPAEKINFVAELLYLATICSKNDNVLVDASAIFQFAVD